MQVIEATKYAGYECTKIENAAIALWVTNDVGPRVIGFQLGDSLNIFAELPDATIDCPGVGKYQLRGGHRLWQAPEDPSRTYLPDDEPVSVNEDAKGLSFNQPVEPQTGIEKSLHVSLPNQGAEVIVEHHLKNHSRETVELAAWAITQLKPGGSAILPQTRDLADQYGLLPNRRVALWPYTEMNSKHITWGDQYIVVQANMVEGALKVGFPNPIGWIGYLREGLLFIKQAEYLPVKEYYDFNSSSECYCNPSFLELETLGPQTILEPGESLSHRETWKVYDQVDYEITEKSVQELTAQLGI
jgi:hypothetical protein